MQIKISGADFEGFAELRKYVSQERYREGGERRVYISAIEKAYPVLSGTEPPNLMLEGLTIEIADGRLPPGDLAELVSLLSRISPSRKKIDEQGKGAESRRIDDEGFSTRIANCLSSQGISTLGELARYTEFRLTRLRNFGQGSLNKVKETLGKYGLSLATEETGHETGHDTPGSSQPAPSR